MGMQVFQRTVIALFSCLVLVACKRQESPQNAVTLKADADTAKRIEIQAFKANLSSTPNIDSVYLSCLFPDSLQFATLPKFSTMTGNTSHFGKLDNGKSTLSLRECYFDTEKQTVGIVMDMMLRNKVGEGLRFLGPVNMSMEGPTSGVFEVIEGYGKFKGFTGWIATEGFLNIELGTIFLSVDGIITQPNNRSHDYFAKNKP